MDKRVWLTALYLSYVLLPFVSSYVSSWVRVALGAIVLLIHSRNFFQCILKLIPLFLISFCTDGLVASLSGTVSYTAMYNYANLLIAAIIGLYILEYREGEIPYSLSKIIILLFSITCVTTIIGNVLFPGASRLLAGVGEEIEIFKFYTRLNIGGFDFVYTATILFPLAICMARCWSNKLFGVTLSALLAGVIIATGYGMATLLLLGASILFLGNTNKSATSIRRLITIMAFLLVVFQSFPSSLLSSIAQYLPSEAASTRLNDLSVALSGGNIEGDSDLVSRSEQYQMSIQGFLSSPLWGTLEDNTGGHSFVLDTLCRFGLMGAFMLLIMLQQIYRIYIRPFTKEYFYGYLLFSFFIYVVCLVANPQPYILCVSLLFPVLTNILSKNESKVRV